MLENYTLAASGEALKKLGEDELAAIVGGFGIPWGTIIGEGVKLLWECVKTGLDDVISAAEEGYSDSQGS